jgi:hypothetical protein
MKVSKSDLEQWHKSPCDNNDGSVTYLGRRYKSRNDLPDHKINGRLVRLLTGRGWDRLGYSDKIDRDGMIDNLTPYNKDGIVDKKEITWGAVGINSISRHIVLVGGRKNAKLGSETSPFSELFTPEQFLSLSGYILDTIRKNPKIKIIGHRDVPNANKTCPNFEVSRFCLLIGINKENTGL